MAEWDIAIPGWILGDGSYEDFRVGQTRSFAVEHWLYPNKTIQYTQCTAKSYVAKPSFRYDVSAEVSYIEDEVWVLDFGIKTYSDQECPISLKRDELVSANIGLGVDYYAYFEFLYKRPSIPPLIYEWEIKRITCDNTPVVFDDGMYRPDTNRTELLDVQSTVRSEAGLPAAYEGITPKYSIDHILHCQLTDRPPRHKFEE